MRTLSVEVPHIQYQSIASRFVPKPWQAALFSRRMQTARQLAGVGVLISCNRIAGADIAICGGTHKGFLAAMGQSADWKDRRTITLETRSYAQADFVIAHSRLMQHELTTLYGLDTAKIVLLYPPVDATRFHPAQPSHRLALRQRYGFGEADTVLLFPSSSHARKGLDMIVRALERLQLANVVLAVVGKPPTHSAPFIRYLGYTHDIESCYQAADYTVLAPAYEPFGLVGVESVLCGTPVIFPDDTGCTEVLADAAKITFTPGDLDSLCDAMQRAVQRGDTTANAASLRQKPLSALTYDCSIHTHVQAIMRLVERLILQMRT